MANFTSALTDWRDNERALIAALSELQTPAARVGLVLDRPQASIEGFPHVLHAEVRPSGSTKILASLDVGLSRDGEMLFQTTPGGMWRFSTFKPRDAAFYHEQFLRLLEAAASSLREAVD